MHAFTDATWRKGLNYWLNDRYNNYGNSQHLYASLQRAVNEDFPINTPNIGSRLETWEMQSGFPVVTITRTGNVLTISQERFMYDTNLQSSNLWWIPLNFVTSSNPNFLRTTPNFWMSNVRNITVPMNIPESDWLLFNIKSTNYYRVNYDHNLWQLLINQLNGDYDRIHYRNRGQLIDDAYNLAKGDRLDYDILFEVMNYLWQETDYIPWVPVSRAGNYLNRRLSGSRIYPHYQEFIRKIVAKLFNYLGVSWRDEENRTERYARNIALTLACQAQLPECLNQTNQELIEHVNHGKWIGTEYVASIYCNGLRTGNPLLFFTVQNKFLLSTDATERWNIIGGMGCTQDSTLLFAFLNLAITPGLQMSFWERSRILTSPASNGENSLLILIEFTQAQFRFINAQSPALLNNILSNISWFIASDALYYRYLLLLSELLCQQAITVDTFYHHVAASRENLDWQAVYLEPIDDFFRRQ
jgi:aminopeptidase N